MQFIGRTVSRAIASIIQAAFLILLSRALGIKEFGTFSTAYSLLTLLAAALSFGVTAQALRAKADASTSILKEKLTSLRFFGTIILVCISVGVMAVSDWSPALIGLAGSLVLSDYWIDYAQAWLAGSDKQFASSSLILMQRIILILPVLVSFLLESSPDPSAELSSVLISLAAFIPISAAIIIVRAKLINPFTGNVRQLLSYWLAGLVGNLKQLEQPSVAYATSSMGLAAGYAMGVRITNPILIVPTALQAVVLPKLLDPGLHTHDKHQLSRRAWLLILVYASLLAATSPLLSRILLLFLGEDYAPFGNLFIAFFLSAGIASLNSFAQTYAYLLNRPALITWSVLPTEVITLVTILCFANINPSALILIIIVGPSIQLLVLLTLIQRYRPR